MEPLTGDYRPDHDPIRVWQREVFNPRHHGELRCGIDFGRTNDPTVCWTLEKVGDTWATRG